MQHAEPSARSRRAVFFIKTLDKVKLASQIEAGASAGCFVSIATYRITWTARSKNVNKTQRDSEGGI